MKHSIISLSIRLLLLMSIAEPTCGVSVTNQPWQSITPGGGGWYESVGIGPSGMMIVGSDLSGAYMSNDNGISWTTIGAAQGLQATHISAVGFHKTDANIVLLGTDNGLYRSTNQAQNFVRVQTDGYITSIQSAQSNSATLYAIGHSVYNSVTPNVYLSTNSGATWVKQAGSGLKNSRIQKLIIHPKRTTELYAVSAADRFTESSGILPTRAIYRSLDSGRTWTTFAATKGAATDFAIVQNNPTEMYLTTNTGVYYSSNSGTTWIDTKRPLEYDYLGHNVGYTLWLDPLAGGTVRLVSNALSMWENTRWGVWIGTKKTNGSFTWVFQNNNQTALQSKVGWDAPDYWHYDTQQSVDLLSNFYHFGESLRTMAIDPRDAKRMVFVNDQWVFQTADGGVKFNQSFTTASGSGWRSRGIDNINTYDVAASRWATGTNVIFGGYADIGCWRSLDDGASWESCNAMKYTLDNPDAANSGGWQGTGGNVTAFAIDNAREGVVWTAMGGRNISSRMTLLRSDDAGKFDSWKYSSAGIAAKDMKNIYGISIDPNSPITQRTLFLTASGEVYRSKDDGKNWSKVLSCRDRSFVQNGVEAYCISTAVDYFNGNLVYAAGSAGVYMSSDGGDSWALVNSTRMTIPSDIDDLFAAYPDYYFVGKIVTDPFVANRAYMAVFDARTNADAGGVWTADGGTEWRQIYANRYARSVAVSPYTPNELVATSSSAYTSGGYNQQAASLSYKSMINFTNILFKEHYLPHIAFMYTNNPQSLGVLRQTASGSWEELAQGLSYKNVSTIIYGNQSGKLILGSMGQGVMRNWR